MSPLVSPRSPLPSAGPSGALRANSGGGGEVDHHGRVHRRRGGRRADLHHVRGRVDGASPSSSTSAAGSARAGAVAIPPPSSPSSSAPSPSPAAPAPSSCPHARIPFCARTTLLCLFLFSTDVSRRVLADALRPRAMPDRSCSASRWSTRMRVLARARRTRRTRSPPPCTPRPRPLRARLTTARAATLPKSQAREWHFSAAPA